MLLKDSLNDLQQFFLSLPPKPKLPKSELIYIPDADSDGIVYSGSVIDLTEEGQDSFEESEEVRNNPVDLSKFDDSVSVEENEEQIHHLDVPLDPGQDEYLAEYLSSDPEVGLSEPVEKGFHFLKELFPHLSEKFLRAEAENTGDNEEKIDEFADWINRQDSSSLPQKTDEEQLEKIMRMKPSDFWRLFPPSPDLHFSDESRSVSEMYRDHAHYYLVSRYAGRVKGGQAEVERVLQEKNDLLVPALKELELQESGQNEGRSTVVRIGLSRPRPSTMNPGFMQELTFVLLEKRIKAVKAEDAGKALFKCLCCSEVNFLSEAVRCSLGCLLCPSHVTKVARSVARQGHDTVFCPCGEEIMLDVLGKAIPAMLHGELSSSREVREAKAAGKVSQISQCPACQKELFIRNSDDDFLQCPYEECFQRSCRLCRRVNHLPFPCKSTITRMKPSRDFDEENDLERKFRMYESHFYRMLHDSSWSIKSIDIVENSWNKREFDLKKEEFDKKKIPATSILVYHGTTKANIQAITASNFDVKKAVRQVHGPGNYFSEYPQTALWYSDDKMHLIVAKILPGKSYKGSGLSWPKYNSKLVKVGEGGYSEMVIIGDSSQILPVAVLHL